MLFSYTSRGNNGARSLTYSLLNFNNKISGDKSVKNGRYIYYFMRNGQNSQEQNDPSVPEMSNLDYSFRCGDFVVCLIYYFFYFKLTKYSHATCHVALVNICKNT